MKFPDGERFRRIVNKIFPAGPSLEDLRQEQLAAIEAEANARKAQAQGFRLGCARRLTPYIGRLFLVNNFKGIQTEENAARISSAIAANNQANDTPLGISTLLSHGRERQDEFLATAASLEASFENTGQPVFTAGTEYESSDFWLLSLARAAESAAEHAGADPEKVGCIAVASALEMHRYANLPIVPAPGGAFKLMDITDMGEEARFRWQAISVDPIDEDIVALSEKVGMFVPGPDNPR